MSRPAKQTANTCLTHESRRRPRSARGLTNPGAERAKENSKRRRRPPPPRPRVVRGGAGVHRRMSKRLSATDISALASMKNVAKCDTWCELQNPVNHRVFERKLRPKPSGRGHVCLGVTHRVAPPSPRTALGLGGRILASRAPRRAAGPNAIPRRPASRQVVVELLNFPVAPRVVRADSFRNPSTSTATPGQAGSPAEFKHINKRRKRNLQGFP